MKQRRSSPGTRSSARRGLALLTSFVLLFPGMGAIPVCAYTLNRVVADARDPRNLPPLNPNPYSSCPLLTRFDLNAGGNLVDRRWNTTLGANILTVTAGTARTSEVEQSILASFNAWASVTGSALRPATLGSLTPTTSPGACNSADGQNTICFAQTATFAPGVLAFTSTITSDIRGEVYAGQTAAFVGEHLDADIYFNPGIGFATPGALPASPTSVFDLESVLIHELGHFFGFGHSGVWRAIMYPFAPQQGTFTGERPSGAVPDGPLAEDDRAGLRVLYPDPLDAVNVGVISGRVLPANPFSLAGQSGVTGIFGAHVVAVDGATGAVMASTIGGWSCSGTGPVQFDGSYVLERLPVNRTYQVYAEPLDGPVTQGNLAFSLDAVCRPYPGETNYPPPFACTRPAANTNFTTRVKP